MRWRRSRLVTDGEAADVGHADVEVVSRGGGGAVDAWGQAVEERAAHVPVVEEERGRRTHRHWLTRGGTRG
jgi:hypothetical protein